MSLVGPAVSVTLDGADLVGRAEVRFEVPAEWEADGLVPVAAWGEPDGSWRWLPSKARQGGTVVVARTAHFSTGALFGFDAGKLAQETFSGIANWATGRAGVPNPKCAEESEVREQVQVRSDTGDSVKWCLGREAGRTVLRVANNRSLYAQVSYPQTWTNLTGVKVGLSWDRILERVTTPFERLAYMKARRTVFLLEPGETMAIAVPDGVTDRVTVKGTPAAFFVQTLKTALDMVFFLRGRAGASQGATTTEKVFAFLGEGKGDDTAWTLAAVSCMGAFANEFLDDMVEPVTGTGQLQKAAKFAMECGSEIGAVSLEDSGPIAWPLTAAVSAAIGIYSIVSTLLTQLVGAGREIFDGIRSLTTNVDDAAYDVYVAPKRTAWVLSPGRVGPLFAGMPASEAVGLGVTRPISGALCGRKWEDVDTEDGSIRWLTWREGDPDDLDNVFFTDGYEGQLPKVKTAEGIGIGSTVEAMKAVYGSQVQSALFTPEGDTYRGYVVFGPAGAMIFGLQLDLDMRPLDNRIDNVQIGTGTNLSNVSYFIGGC